MRARELTAEHVGHKVTLFREGTFLKGRLTEVRYYAEVTDIEETEDGEGYSTTMTIYAAVELDNGVVTIDPVHPDMTVEVED